MKKLWFLSIFLAPTLAVAAPESATIAIHSHTRGEDDLGTILLEVLEVELAGKPGIELVDRARLRDLIAEQELGAAGVTNEKAASFGKLVGANYYIFGETSKAGNRSMVRCRVVQVDTGVYRPTMVLLAEDQDPMEAGAQLAGKILAEIAKLDSRVAATPVTEKPELKLPEGAKLPTLAFRIPEISVTPGAANADPAAEKNLEAFLLGHNFTLVQLSRPSQAHDVGAAARQGLFGGNTATEARHLEGKEHEELFAEAASKKVDIVILGIAASQTAARIGIFHTARARVELAAVRVSDRKILAVADGYGIASDISLFVAEKKSIEDATARLNVSFTSKIVEAFNAAAR
jgi:hypothetical protein